MLLKVALHFAAYLYNKYAMEKTMVYLLTEATKTTTGIEEGAMFDNSLNGYVLYAALCCYCAVLHCFQC